MKHWPVRTTFVFAIALILALPVRPQQDPYTQEQVRAMVLQDGLGDESGAKAIEARGVDFAPTEDFLRGLRAAGANELFLAALRAAKHPQLPRGATKMPLDALQIGLLLNEGIPSQRVAILVQERGIDFEPHDGDLQQVRRLGGEDELISALKTAKVEPVTVHTAEKLRRAEVEILLLHAADFKTGGQLAEEEQELRSALRLDPQNAGLHRSLGRVLHEEHDDEGTAVEFRRALIIEPDDEWTREALSATLRLVAATRFSKHDWGGAIVMYRLKLRMTPNDADSHQALGIALGERGDWDEDIAEQRRALHLKSNDADAHYYLGDAYGH
jgi:tetratricopeptide (TPR) repeat protein